MTPWVRLPGAEVEERRGVTGPLAKEFGISRETLDNYLRAATATG
ncbi:hypothetical protein [Cellulomonas sp.]|nr:hypothetical protein [Cellulomonas sp.]